jgi:hypothetical protein
MEAAGISETSVDFCQTARCSNTRQVIFILAAVRTWNVTCLIVVYLTKLLVVQINTRVINWQVDWWRVNWKVEGSNCGLIEGSCLERLNIIAKIFVQGSLLRAEVWIQDLPNTKRSANHLTSAFCAFLIEKRLEGCVKGILLKKNANRLKNLWIAKEVLGYLSRRWSTVWEPFLVCCCLFPFTLARHVITEAIFFYVSRVFFSHFRWADSEYMACAVW